MVISPILIIIVSAIVVAAVVFYIINRPKVPIFTGVALLLLLISVFCTFAINVELSSKNSTLSAENNIIRWITTFITLEREPPVQLLQQSFNLFSYIDIGLVLAVVVTSVIEMKTLFKIK